MRAACLLSLSLLAACCHAGEAEKIPQDIFNAESLCYETASQVSNANSRYIAANTDVQAFVERTGFGAVPDMREAIQTFATSLEKRAGETLKRRPVHVSAFRPVSGAHECLLLATVRKTADLADGIYGLRLIIADTPAGPKIVDWQALSQSLSAAATLGKVYTDALYPDLISRSGDQVIVHTQAPTSAFLPSLSALSRALGSNNASTITQAFAGLPESIAKQPFYLALVVAALTSLKATELPDYQAGLDAAAAGDPRYDFMLLDYYYDKNNQAGIARALDHMRQTLAGEPDINMLAMSAALARQDQQAFFAQSLDALQSNPSISSVYWIMLSQFASTASYDDCLLVVDVLHQQFRADLGRLRASSITKDMGDIGNFIKSPQFAGWLEKHATPQAGRGKNTDTP
jgi:CheY-like chemotaxis protein